MVLIKKKNESMSSFERLERELCCQWPHFKLSQHVLVDDRVEYFLPEDDSCECIVKSSS